MKRRIIPLVFVFVLTLISIAAWRLWPRVPEGMSRRTVWIGEREVGMIVLALPASGRVELVADAGNPKSVRAWREETGAAIAFNGSYFDEENAPTGYYRSGERGSDVPWPSREEQADAHGYTFAVSVVNGELRLRYLPRDPSDEPSDATFLSFPTLVSDGESMVAEDSGLLARRTALAEDADGNDYLVVTERGALSLFELSRWLADQPEGFVLAGNLDGGPSTGVSIENDGWDVEVLSVQVPNVIAVYLRR